MTEDDPREAPTSPEIPSLPCPCLVGRPTCGWCHGKGLLTKAEFAAMHARSQGRPRT